MEHIEIITEKEFDNILDEIDIFCEKENEIVFMGGLKNHMVNKLYFEYLENRIHKYTGEKKERINIIMKKLKELRQKK